MDLIKSWFRKGPPINPEAHLQESEGLDKKVGDTSKILIKPPSSKNSAPIWHSTPPQNTEAVTLYAMPVLYPKRLKHQSSSIVPINTSSPLSSDKETRSTTPSLSNASSKEPFYEATSKSQKTILDMSLKELLSISGRADKIILTDNQTVGTLVKEAQGKMTKIENEITSLESAIQNEINPKMKSWGEEDLEKLEETKLELNEKLTFLQKLSTIQETASSYQQTVADEVFPFETNYTSIQKEVSSVEVALQGSFNLEDPMDIAKHDLLSFKKEELNQLKQDLLGSCIDQKADLPLKMNKLNIKTKNVEREHIESHSAFTSVFQEVLKAKKTELEQKNVNLTKIIRILKKDLKTSPIDNGKLKDLKAVSEESWDSLCSTLVSLPKKGQDHLINKLENQGCDLSIIRDLEEFLLNKEELLITTVEDRLYFIDQLKLNGD